MNELIKITEKEGKQLVSARELHEFLESGQDFTTWIKSRIEKYDFVEGENFTLHKFMVGKVWKHDYAITVDMAKELSMVENNDKGSQARKYFINCEKALKEKALNTTELSPELQMFNKMFQALANNELEQKRLKTEIQDTNTRIDGIKEIVTLNPNSWRTEVINLLNKIAIERGGTQEAYRNIRNESYELLDARAGAKLSIRLTNMKRKILEETGSKSKANKVTKLEVVAADKRLTEVYLAIVKDMAIKYLGREVI